MNTSAPLIHIFGNDFDKSSQVIHLIAPRLRSLSNSRNKPAFHTVKLCLTEDGIFVCVNDPDVAAKSPSKSIDASVEENSSSQEARLRLQKALSQLAPLERKCVLMFAEGHSYKEIALHHNLTCGVTMDAIRRSIRKLRK